MVEAGRCLADGWKLVLSAAGQRTVQLAPCVAPGQQCKNRPTGSNIFRLAGDSPVVQGVLAGATGPHPRCEGYLPSDVDANARRQKGAGERPEKLDGDLPSRQQLSRADGHLIASADKQTRDGGRAVGAGRDFKFSLRGRARTGQSRRTATTPWPAARPCVNAFGAPRLADALLTVLGCGRDD